MWEMKEENFKKSRRWGKECLIHHKLHKNREQQWQAWGTLEYRTAHTHLHTLSVVSFVFVGSAWSVSVSKWNTWLVAQWRSGAQLYRRLLVYQTTITHPWPSTQSHKQRAFVKNVQCKCCMLMLLFGFRSRNLKSQWYRKLAGPY